MHLLITMSLLNDMDRMRQNGIYMSLPINPSKYIDKVVSMQKRLNQKLTKNQLLELIDEAAALHEDLCFAIMRGSFLNQRELVELSNQFVFIENEIFDRFYGPSIKGRTEALL